MNFPDPHQENDRLFNNADSFAMVFDKAWENLSKDELTESATEEEKLERVITLLKTHPFVESSPIEAKKVARFRIRLLNLS